MRKALAVSFGLVLTASLASAATIVLNPSTTTVDDVSIAYGSIAQNWGADGNFSGQDWGLLGYKNLLTDVPLTSGGNPIAIDSATLKITTNVSAGGSVWVYRVTGDWLHLAAGQSQNNANCHYRDMANNLTWASEPTYTQTFGGLDYDASSLSTGTLSSGNYNAVTTFDVTTAVSSLFASGVNQGFAVKTQNSGYVRSQESGMSPEMTINYHYAPVPEPAALGLALVSGLGVLSRRHQRA